MRRVPPVVAARCLLRTCSQRGKLCMCHTGLGLSLEELKSSDPQPTETKRCLCLSGPRPAPGAGTPVSGERRAVAVSQGGNVPGQHGMQHGPPRARQCPESGSPSLGPHLPGAETPRPSCGAGRGRGAETFPHIRVPAPRMQPPRFLHLQGSRDKPQYWRPGCSGSAHVAQSLLASPGHVPRP